LEHRIGKFSLRGILLPTILLDDKIDARIILDFISPNRPAQEQEFTIKPGERVNFEGAIEYTVDYSDKVQRQREIGFSYAIEKQLWFGIAYRHGLSQYESISLIPGEMHVPATAT
jgi:hypothetical protein